MSARRVFVNTYTEKMNMNWLNKTRELLGESLDIIEEGYKEAKAKWGDESSTTIEQFKK